MLISGWTVEYSISAIVQTDIERMIKIRLKLSTEFLGIFFPQDIFLFYCIMYGGQMSNTFLPNIKDMQTFLAVSVDRVLIT